MDPRKLFVDERLTGMCCFCGREPDTRDHVPSRILLDDPFPDDLPVVDACRSCNESFSQDEEYLACLLECAIRGTVEPSDVSRPKVARILPERPLLAARLRECCHTDESGNLVWQADTNRVRNIIVKLARGHMAYDLGLPQLDDPEILGFIPLVAMSDSERNDYESPPPDGEMLYPEIGSRAFIGLWKPTPSPWHNWRIVQPGRYRYRIGQSAAGDSIQFVLSEYLACRVVWA